MDGLIQQNSLLFSLLAGNLVQRPVRNGLHRQPGSPGLHQLTFERSRAGSHLDAERSFSPPGRYRRSGESREASSLEHRLFDRLMDLLDGFKEVRLNSLRSDELFEDVVEVSRVAANIKIRAQSETFKRMVFLQSALYGLLGTIAFAIPTFSGGLGAEAVTKTITALVFIVGTCFGLVQAIPILSAANTAADNIERLEARLLATIPVTEVTAVEPAERFQKIEMRNVVFRYVDKWSDAVFQVGPIDFTLRAGELVFITGGNGSGKSTFLKLLAGLYKPDSGEVIFDGVRVDDRTRQAYRELIAAIFPDYHLFEKLYGVPDPDPAEVDRLLTQFRLHDKTHLTDTQFSTLDLSAGQRKRLALIVALLEKRPLLLLDEWAAERKLKNEGFNLILPWNRVFLYDLRLQSFTEPYNAISSDGVSLTATVIVRFRLQRDSVPVLHQAIGPNYEQVLVQPGIGSLTRQVIAEYTAEQAYSTARPAHAN
jgi:ABC-type lipoprotein export system ATPase subunit